MNRAALEKRLAHPGTGISLILDTDTFNEVDDQFALAYALRSRETMTVEAIYAAPFHNDRSTGPGDGMEKSHEEILRVLGRLGEPSAGRVFRGSPAFLETPDTPVESEAAHHLVETAMARSPDDPPLYVAAIAAITNIASALLMEPRISERIVVLWLGGNIRRCFHAKEFNLRQDPAAARIVFDSGVPIIWFPCLGVSSHLVTTLAELERDLAGRSAIGDYLVEIVRGYHDDHFAWGKVIWDIAPIGWLVNPDWVATRIEPSPVLCEDLGWRDDSARHPIREALYIDRNAVFRDLFAKLAT